MKNPYINYSLNESNTAQSIWKPSDSSFNNYIYNQLEINSLEKKIEHSNVITQEIKIDTTLQKSQKNG